MRKSHKLRLASALGLIALSPAWGVELSCYETPGTRETMCVNEHAVHANGNLRSSIIYKGGPKGVLPLPYTLIVDCKRRVATLQDEQGVNFGASTFDETPNIKALSKWLCEAKKTQQDKQLIQF